MSADVVTGRWVLLVYRLPREPSTPRIAVWRKLKQLGVVQLSDGLVALPLDARNREQLEWVADEVMESGGEATMWLAQPASVEQERHLAEAMSAARAEEYQAIVAAAHDAGHADPSTARRTLERLRRELQRISRRDYFPPPERERARTAVQTLAQTLSASREQPPIAAPQRQATGP